MAPSSWRARAKTKSVEKKGRRACGSWRPSARQRKEDKALFDALTMADIRAWWRVYR